MTDSRLAKLLTINRSDSPADLDPRWPDVERALRLKLPIAYMTLIDLFGASCWDDFLYVLSPFDESLNLQRRGGQVLEADRQSRRAFPSHYPLGLYPEPNGLLPWAVTANGDTMYFITFGPPDDWPTLIRGPRAPEFEVSFLTPPLLVHHIVAGAYRSGILAEP